MEVTGQGRQRKWKGVRKSGHRRQRGLACGGGFDTLPLGAPFHSQCTNPPPSDSRESNYGVRGACASGLGRLGRTAS